MQVLMQKRDYYCYGDLLVLEKAADYLGEEKALEYYGG
jgi:hypothetical protein